MENIFHSVRLDDEKCQGCTNCIKRCPTQAIRVRNKKAYIISDRCIDCGECIRVCPHHAKYAVSEHFNEIVNYKYIQRLLYLMKEKLRELGIKTTEMSQYMRVSRPSLYKYIELYESKDYKQIPDKVLRVFKFIDRYKTVRAPTIRFRFTMITIFHYF